MDDEQGDQEKVETITQGWWIYAGSVILDQRSNSRHSSGTCCPVAILHCFVLFNVCFVPVHMQGDMDNTAS